MASILEAARAWYARGFTPMAARNKRPLAKGWQALDPAEHLAAIERETPRQIGLRMGTQRDGRILVAVDVDDQLGLAALEKELGILPPTLTQRTGSGGQHLVYVWPSELEAPTTNASKLAKGIDIRCERGHIVAAPSPHESGNAYEVTDDRDPVPLPSAYAEALLPAPEVAIPPPLVINPSQQLQDCLSYTARMQAAISGSGGHKLTFDVALKCVEFALNQSDSLYVLQVYNARCQPPWTKRELEHKIKSAFKTGKVKSGTKGSMAREPLPERTRNHERRTDRHEPAPDRAGSRATNQPDMGAHRAPVSDEGARLRERPSDVGEEVPPVPPREPAARKVAAATEEPKQQPAKQDDSGLDPEWCSPDIETWWLPTPIQDWVVAQSECRQVPALMPAMAALCTLAAICQGRSEVKFCAAPAEPLSLYWFLFAGTGTRKSTIMNAAARPVRRYMQALKEQVEPEKRAALRTKARLEADEKRLMRVKVSDYTAEGQARKNELAAIGHELDTLKIPSVPMMLVSDINQQLLPRILKRNLEADGIAACAALDAEGTIAANMLGRSTGHVHVDTLLKASMGEPLELVRMSQSGDEPYEAVLPHAHVTLGVMCQPHYIDRFREHPELSDTGFMGRCIFSSMPNIRDIQGDEQEVPERITAAYEACVQRLAQADLPEVVDLSKSAPWALWRDTLPDLGTPGWKARVLGRVARIAALCELVEGVEDGASATVVEDATVVLSQAGGGGSVPARGNKRIEGIYKYLILRDTAGIQILERPSTMRSVMARRVAPRLTTVGQCVTVREVQRWLRISKQQALDACDELVEAGYLEQAGETRRHNKTVTVTYRVTRVGVAPKPEKRKPARWVFDDETEAGGDPEQDGR